jgi:hypothetical protein
MSGEEGDLTHRLQFNPRWDRLFLAGTPWPLVVDEISVRSLAIFAAASRSLSSTG